ncbi:TPA: VWA domain-containing protein [Streptococcus suis]
MIKKRNSRYIKSLFCPYEIFSIRKLSLGVASVLLGSLILGGYQVQAEDIQATSDFPQVAVTEELPTETGSQVANETVLLPAVVPQEEGTEATSIELGSSQTATPSELPSVSEPAREEVPVVLPQTDQSEEVLIATDLEHLEPERVTVSSTAIVEGSENSGASAMADPEQGTSSSASTSPEIIEGEANSSAVNSGAISSSLTEEIELPVPVEAESLSTRETSGGTYLRSARSSSSYTERSVAPLVHHVYDPEEAVKKQVQADITFVIDTTGSMTPYIDRVKNNLVELTSYLEKNDVNFGISVVTYKDSLEDGEDSTVIEKFSNNEYWAYDVDTVKEKLEELYVAGGGDDPETVAEGLKKVSDLQRIPTYLNRTHAKRFAFLLTDADYKQDKVSMEDVISKFKMSGIRTTVISRPEYEEVYRSLYTETQGEFIDINKESYSEVMADFAKVIKESIDSDGDGLLDDWEEFGLKDEKGNVILDLPAMGANKHMKDLFVQVDWMHKEITTPIFKIKIRDIDVAPSAESMEMVRKQFLDHGIQLHIDMGPDSVMKYEGGKAVTWGDLSAGGNRLQYKDVFEVGSNYEHWNRVVTDYLPKNRWNVFRHAFFVNAFSINGEEKGTGVASAIPGQAFIVALKNNYDNNLAVAGTFMHELGHTLGLGHGGDDHTNGKPNHLSVMNYLFQLSGLVYSKTNFEHWVDFLFGEKEAYKRLNFSEYALPALNEKALREKDGIDPYHVITDKRLGTKIADANRNNAVEIHNVADGKDIDFNFNGRIDEGTVTANISRPEKIAKGQYKWVKYDKDLNQVDEETIMLSASVNEWERLVFKGGYIGSYGLNVYDAIETLIRKPSDEDDHSHDHENEEMTVKDYLELGLLANKGASYLSGIYPTYLEVGLNNQNLIVDIVNPHFESSIAKIEVQSSLVAETARVKTVTLEPSISDLVITSLGIPVIEDVKAGSYPVRVILYSEDGQVQVIDEVIQVTENVTMNLKVGERYSLPNLEEGFTWSIGSEEIIELSTDQSEMLAKNIGRAVLMLSISGQVVEKWIVTVSGQDILKPSEEIQGATSESSKLDVNPNLIFTEATWRKGSQTTRRITVNPTPTVSNKVESQNLPSVSVENSTGQSLPNTGQTTSIYPTVLGLSLLILGLGRIRTKQNTTD